MLLGMSAALSGVRSFSRRLSVSGHNVANVATPGFKAQRLEVADAASTGLGLAQAAADQAGMGVQSVGLYRLMTSGGALHTGRPLDLAIDGPGFFQVSRGGETLYSRAGALTMNSEGYLTDPAGNRLEPPIQVPPTAQSMTIDAGGGVSIIGPDGQEIGAGQIQLVSFPDPQSLAAQGGNLFAATAAAGAPIISVPGQNGLGRIRQGFLETSNVDLAGEMVDQITAEAGFKANVKTLQTADEMLGTVIDLIE
ncbi:MAG: flagellar hook-basal body protein [Proteobacteria bacterium]|nr:flagellar hook-basal body protein [Pseudomonadota bacterium]MBU1742636.1 flagellar hook-basal body protein [Pseudomonadota bacterium]